MEALKQGQWTPSGRDVPTRSESPSSIDLSKEEALRRAWLESAAIFGIMRQDQRMATANQDLVVAPGPLASLTLFIIDTS